MSRDKRSVYAESDTEVDYSGRLNMRSETRPAATRHRPTPAAAAAVADADDDAHLRHHPHHRRQTSLPHSSTVGLCVHIVKVK